MREKLKTGRYLELPQFDSSAGPDVVPGPAHFVSEPGRNYQIQMAEGSGFLNHRRTSTVSAGPHLAKAHRNFRWLHWQPGKITYLPLLGTDILTGPMSGCWIVIFDMGGASYVGHIGTAAPDSVQTLQVKAAWAAAFAAGTVVPTAAFQPNRYLGVATTGFDRYYGVVTAQGDLIALRCHRAGFTATLNRIVTVVEVDGAGVAPGAPDTPNFV